MSNPKQTALRALQLIDLTSLNKSDTDESIIKLCKKAKTAAGNTAAVCIYPEFIPVARRQLELQGTPQIRIATVTNFPHGNDNIATAVEETRAAVANGADEVDVVFPYRSLMAGTEETGYELVKQCKEACGKVQLKVIIETGELKEESLIRKASEIAIKAGADFIKTSTGKVPVNATPEAAEIMLSVIKDMGVQDSVGFKPAGGVRSVEDTEEYLALADKYLGSNWATPDFFRFGASGLLDNLLYALGESEEVVESGY